MAHPVPHPKPLHLGLFDPSNASWEQARAAFDDLVRSLLPSDAAGARGAVVAGLDAPRSLASHQATAEDLVAGDTPLDWVVVLDPPTAPAVTRLLDAASRRLGEGGALVVGTPVACTPFSFAIGMPEPPDPAALSWWVLSLLERGFAIRRDLDVGAAVRPSFGELRRRIAIGDVATTPVTQAIESLLARLDSNPTIGYRLFQTRHDGYRVRSVAPGDEHPILDLFGRSFHVVRGVDHWRWKYQDNPYGRERVSLCCTAAGELVAHYAAYPVRLYRGATVAGGPAVEVIHQVGDTMTATHVRSVGRGPTSLLGRTSRHFYAAFCEGRVAFNYGFNTANHQKFSLRFVRAQKVEEAPYRRLTLGSGKPGAAPPLGVPASYRVERVTEVDSRFDDFYLGVRDRYSMLVERDARYLRWRYLDRPDLEYRLFAVNSDDRLVGWGVFSWRERELVWGDALFDPHHVAAVEALLRMALDGGGPATRTEAIVGWFPVRPLWWHHRLDELGFELGPEPQNLGLVAVPFLDPDPVPALRAYWYYTYGDSDLF